MDYAYDKSKVKAYNVPAQAIEERESSGLDLLSIIGDIAKNYITYSDDRLGTLSTSTPMLPTDTEIFGHTLNAQWEISDTVTLRSITAYRELDDKSYVDFSSGSTEEFRINFGAATIGANAGEDRLDLPANRPHLEQEQWTQEFQLLGSLGDSVDYMAGLYYFYEEGEEQADLRHVFSAFPFAGGRIYNIGAEYNRIENDALAFFTQLTWTPNILDERLHLTLGWRHSEDTREAQREVTERNVVDQDTFVSVLTDSSFVADTDNDFDDDSITLVAEYDLSDDLNLYAKYSEAYKSGGFNIRDPEEAGFNDGFDEEKLKSGEVGVKGEALDRRVRFSAVLFPPAVR